MDLREEINRCRGGEGSRTTIERNRERRRDIEGCNLERYFVLHARVGACQAAHAPLPLGSLGVWGGGVHGIGPTPANGGLATQILAPLAREI
jgi:hypothetical protein